MTQKFSHINIQLDRFRRRQRRRTIKRAAMCVYSTVSTAEQRSFCPCVQHQGIPKGKEIKKAEERERERDEREIKAVEAIRISSDCKFPQL